MTCLACSTVPPPPLWRTVHALRLRTTLCALRTASSVFVMRIPLAAPPAKLWLQLPLSDSQILFFCLLLTLGTASSINHGNGFIIFGWLSLILLKLTPHKTPYRLKVSIKQCGIDKPCGTLTYRFNISIPLYFKYYKLYLIFVDAMNFFHSTHIMSIKQELINPTFIEFELSLSIFGFMPNHKSGTFDADCQSIFLQLHFSLSPYFHYPLFNFRFYFLTQTGKHVEPNVFCLSEFVKVYLIPNPKKYRTWPIFYVNLYTNKIYFVERVVFRLI